MIGQTLSGTLYVSSISIETNAIYRFEQRASSASHTSTGFGNIITSQSATAIGQVSASQADYVFTDPPFGGNIMYSELNFLWEAWLRVFTNNRSEAITNKVQKKALPEYQGLMAASFAECFRILKPGRWMTVEFHNSANSVWGAIQEALQRVGFIVADVRVLNKTHNSFKQVTSKGAVKKDLAISCYKPHSDFERRFTQVQGKIEGVFEFLRQHLDMLPVAPINENGLLEPTAERTRDLLFDRMLAYHLQRGARIPVSAAEFYALLTDQFVERDEMYFTPEQAAKYDALRARGVDTEQLSIFVQDEKTSVQWIRGVLLQEPQTLGDLTPKFLEGMGKSWPKHEPRPELRDLLHEYFVHEDGIWRVPDPENEKDLEQLRRNTMLRQFREYVSQSNKLKMFRKEALLEGFKHCWQTKQYGVIVSVCERIPAKILEDDHDLIQFYDIAKDLAPEPTGDQLSFVWE